MNRRHFLRLFGAGLAATAIEQQFGLATKAASYFFAPRGGWNGGFDLAHGSDVTAYLEARELQIQEICRIFRVPRHLVGNLRVVSITNPSGHSPNWVKQRFLEAQERPAYAVMQLGMQ